MRHLEPPLGGPPQAGAVAGGWSGDLPSRGREGVSGCQGIPSFWGGVPGKARGQTGNTVPKTRGPNGFLTGTFQNVGRHVVSQHLCSTSIRGK